MTAANTKKAFQSIIEEDNDSVYPTVCYTDRGSEFLSTFSAFLSEQAIKQVFTTSAQQNKSFPAERVIRTLRRYLAKLHFAGLRELKKALINAVETYNNSLHTSHGLTPLEAEKSERLAHVLEKYQTKRFRIFDKYLESFRKMNKEFKLGDLVRYKLPKPGFAKESDTYFTTEVYQIIGIIPSGPLKGYKLQDRETGVNVAGSFLLDQLLPA